ncbi:hypothetical protein PUN28_006801 [Cardiocondyla obscurior]|uniref:Uncharacterized protein n=1 Tax=Cardiocondyla obscurior TaxID=286306 RepID=A0AAW2FZS4_9HYME
MVRDTVIRNVCIPCIWKIKSDHLAYGEVPGKRLFLCLPSSTHDYYNALQNYLPPRSSLRIKNTYDIILNLLLNNCIILIGVSIVYIYSATIYIYIYMFFLLKNC